MRSRRASAARRGKGPKAVIGQKAGYITADTLQSKVFICPLAAEVRRDCSAIRAGMSVVTRAQSSTPVVRPEAPVRTLQPALRQVGKVSRISSKKRHE